MRVSCNWASAVTAVALLWLASGTAAHAQAPQQVPPTKPQAHKPDGDRPSATEHIPTDRIEQLDRLVDGVQAFYERNDSFKASFEQSVVRKFRPGGQKATPRKGTAYFLKPGKMRWDYQSPDAVYYISNGDTLWVYEPDQKRAYRGKVQGSRLWDSMKFLFGAAKLREEFNVVMGESTDTYAELLLEPKGGQMDFRQLALRVDPTTFEIRQTRLVDPAGDESVIAFSDAVYAPIKNPEWFEWAPGDDVRVEDLSKRTGP